MSSGSLKQFLKKTKKNNKTLKVIYNFVLWHLLFICSIVLNARVSLFCWGFLGLEKMVYPDTLSLKVNTTLIRSSFTLWKWMIVWVCTKWSFYDSIIYFCIVHTLYMLFSCIILSNSLSSYLHTCEPPVVHGNLTTDTVFIQHNGLIKIGCGMYSVSAYTLAVYWFTQEGEPFECSNFISEFNFFQLPQTQYLTMWKHTKKRHETSTMLLQSMQVIKLSFDAHTHGTCFRFGLTYFISKLQSSTGSLENFL